MSRSSKGFKTSSSGFWSGKSPVLSKNQRELPKVLLREVLLEVSLPFLKHSRDGLRIQAYLNE